MDTGCIKGDRGQGGEGGGSSGLSARSILGGPIRGKSQAISAKARDDARNGALSRARIVTRDQFAGASAG